MDTSGGEERVGADEEDVDSLAHKRCERDIDLPAGAALEDLDLQSYGAGSRFRVSEPAGLASTATFAAAGISSRRSSSRFGTNSADKTAENAAVSMEV
jgi:hypothetical protein